MLARFEFRGKSLLRALTGIPFVLPTLVVAMAFNALLGPRGWVNGLLMAAFDLPAPPIQFINTLIAILVAHVFYNTTIILRMVGDFWTHLNPRLEDAARSLGANRWATWRYITLPLLTPALSAAALLVFIFNFTSFGVVLILGGPRFATLEVEIYYQTISLFNLPTAAALALIQLATTLGLTILYTRMAARLSTPMQLRSRQFTQRPLLSWQSRVLAAVVIGIVLFLILAPLTGLMVRSFTRLDPDRGQQSPAGRGLTLDFYRELSADRRQSLFYAPPTQAIVNSLRLRVSDSCPGPGPGTPRFLGFVALRGESQ